VWGVFRRSLEPTSTTWARVASSQRRNGRAALIGRPGRADPTGATFQLSEAKAHIEVKIRNEPNSLCWSELTTEDPQAAIPDGALRDPAGSTKASI